MNHCFANWLAARHEVVAFFAADVERRSLQNHWRWLRRRVRRVGGLRAIDQVLYQLHYRLFQEPTDRLLMIETFATAFGRRGFVLPPSIPVYEYPGIERSRDTATAGGTQARPRVRDLYLPVPPQALPRDPPARHRAVSRRSHAGIQRHPYRVLGQCVGRMRPYRLYPATVDKRHRCGRTASAGNWPNRSGVWEVERVHRPPGSHRRLAGRGTGTRRAREG